MSGFEIAFIAAAAASGYAGIQAAKAKKNMYDAEARMVEKQATIKANNSKQQAINVLKNMNAVMASNVARGGAGNMDPFSSGDSVDIVNTASLRDGVTDFTIARDNATMALKMGKYQADNYRYAGRAAVANAKTMAVINVASSVATAGMIGGESAFGGLGKYFSGNATTTASLTTGQKVGAAAIVGVPMVTQQSNAIV